jgi:hypothetical protein
MWRSLFTAFFLLLWVTGCSSAPAEQPVTLLKGPALVMFYTDG